MHLVRFRNRSGSVNVGEMVDDGIVFGGRRYDRDDVEILPPVNPTKIVCLRSNYIEHIKEAGRSIPEEIPNRPGFFLKGPNAVAGHGDTVELPKPDADPNDLAEKTLGDIELGSGRIDYEGEVGVVIGTQCKNVQEEDAYDVIEGFTCVNDLSNRDDQALEQNWIRGKAFDNSTPIGPVVATPDEVEGEPRVQLWLNGEKRQDSANDELVFSIPEAIASVTKFVTLEPGDILAMGTTVGVGPVQDSDRIEIEVEGVGRLEHSVTVP